MIMPSKTNVIEWVDVGSDDIVWAYGSEDIRWGSIVVVHEYETAIFMRDGKIYDVLPPGRHAITTQNIPILTRIFRLVGGYGETPFKANIIFVSLKQHRGKFGTSTRVKLGPRTLYMTEVQAFGEYWHRVEDPVLFLTQAVGAAASFSASDVTNFVRSFFTELFLQELAKFSAIDVYTHLEEVTSKIKTGTVFEAFKQRGLELIDLKCSGINLPLLERMEKDDPTYGLPLMVAIQKGDEDKVLEITKVVESMRALGKAPGGGVFGALIAMPSLLGSTMPPAQQQQTSAPAAPSAKSPIDRLRELKQMMDEGLITAEEYENVKKEILSQMKKATSQVEDGKR
jgi:membrane protease subunit (stomatin/prohibitin family)